MMMNMDIKTILIVAAASLMTLSAGAQLKRSAPIPQRTQSLSQVITEDVMEMNRSDGKIRSVKLSSRQPDMYYRRPAGAFSGSLLIKDGCYDGNVGFPLFLMLKPYADYTFKAIGDGLDSECTYRWYRPNLPYDPVGKLTVSYEPEMYGMPIMEVLKGGSVIGEYQYAGYDKAWIYAYPTFRGYEDYELLLSSKTFLYGDNNTMLTYFTGCTPYGENEKGWWFGKNGAHIDGMAQAFEKPEHPYLLKKVEMLTTVQNFASPVEMKCKIYRLDEIPPYNDTASVSLPEEPGELVAIGTGSFAFDTGGLVEFQLYSFDEDDPDILYEEYLTVDYPMLIVVDGYNDPAAEELKGFSAYISSDYHFDEGYGELAYLKSPINDEEGNFTGEYQWKGLNNFFASGEMKTGFSIFIVADQPYLAFNRDDEPGEYTFDEGGGEMRWQNQIFEWNTGIEFKSSTPSGDDDWSISCLGSSVPGWLDISLVDGIEYGDFNGIVTAHVVAEPLPQTLNFRKAVVRFQIPGDYKDYTFIQERICLPLDCDVNGDGEVNIADVNCVIDVILGGNDIYEGRTDVNRDGEINIADVNAVIDKILGQNQY